MRAGLTCARSASEVLTGPDWSLWPKRTLGRADSAVIGHWAGTHRLISPDDTWQAVQPLLDRAGITRVADLTWLDDLGIRTVQAVRPASPTLSVSQGKAPTYRAAQVSAVMESLANWHAENLTANLLSTSTADLAAILTYDPAQLGLPVGSLYHPGAKLDWVVATTLLSGRYTWLPWAAVVVNVAMRDGWDPPMITMDTNGLASGDSYDEAALHALYKIMERHSVAAAEPGVSTFEVSLDDVAYSDCAYLVDLIYRAGSALQIARIDDWDGYYCFAAELTSPMTEVPFSGFGLHHDPNVALSRAITEAAQSRLTAISGAREHLPPAIYRRLARLHAYPPARRVVHRLPAAASTPWHERGTGPLPRLLAAAASAVAGRTGIEPLATVCDFARGCVPVVRVLAPGLQSSMVSPLRMPLQDPV